MSKYAKKVTKFRKIIRERALTINASYNDDEAAAYLQTTEKLARKMHNGYFPTTKKENICKAKYMSKKQRWHEFSLDDKVNLIHDVIVGKEKIEVVAKRYFRTKGFVSNLITKMKKNPNLLRELIDNRD